MLIGAEQVPYGMSKLFKSLIRVLYEVNCLESCAGPIQGSHRQNLPGSCQVAIMDPMSHSVKGPQGSQLILL